MFSFSHSAVQNTPPFLFTKSLLGREEECTNTTCGKEGGGILISSQFSKDHVKICCALLASP